MNLEETLCRALQIDMEVPTSDSVSGGKKQQKREENKYGRLNIVFLH